MYLVDTVVGHPTLHAWKYPLPGDEAVTMISRVVIDVESGKMVRLQMPPDQHRSTLCDDVACRGEWGDVQWSADGSTIAFVSTARDHRREQMRVADAATGKIRDVLEEKAETFFESGNGAVNWRYLPASNEVIWFSERDNWGHLYLHDLRTGREKHAITRGEGNVTQVLRVDEQKRLVYFVAVGRERGRDPYFRHLYRIGHGRRDLPAPHAGGRRSRRGRSRRRDAFSSTVYSTPDVPPVVQLRDADGRVVLAIEKADITRLAAAGWQPPMPITVKARDGVTDLYGLMYKPTNLDPAKKYPIVNHIYPGPQTGSVGARTFNPSRGDAQALAELGFVVVETGRDGNAVAVEEIPRGLLRQHGRQHAARPGRGHEGAGGALSVDRHRSRRHLRTLGRRLRGSRCACSGIPISSRLVSRRPATTTTVCTKTTGPRNGRVCSRSKPDGTHQLRQPGESADREESQRETAARARHDGRRTSRRTTRCSSSTRSSRRTRTSIC